MKIIDISMRLSNSTIAYPGDPKIAIARKKGFQNDKLRLSEITMGAHSGTHVDAPAHFLKDGKSIDEVGLKPLIGRAIVFDLTFVDKSILASDLEECPAGQGDILLLKTRNSGLLKRRRFTKDFVHLSSDAADYVVKTGVKAVGIDYLSIEEYGSRGNYVHKRLLSCGIPIIEGLDFRGVRPGGYTLFCLPLNVVGCEAAPARCVLLTDQRWQSMMR
jgi:arylformamidase